MFSVRIFRTSVVGHENTTILEHQNNKQKLQIFEALYIETFNPQLTELIFKPLLMYLNVFSYWH